MAGRDIRRVILACITGLLATLVATATVAFTDAERCRMAREENQIVGRIINTYCLGTGRYHLVGEVPVVRHYNPPDPLRAIGQMQHLPPGSVIQIQARLLHGGSAWYQIAKGGYINSIALMNNIER